MKAVVTGAAGFIGSTLVESLLEDGWDVVGVDNLDDYYSGKMQFLKKSMRNVHFRFIKADILDLDTMRKVMSGCDAVAHMAAQAGVRFSVKDPLKSNMVNVVGTINVLLASLEGNVPRVVNSSSSSVYGNPKVLPVRESDPVSPVSPYATSKLSAEYYCRQFYELYGLDTVSLRYFTVYGPRQRPDMAIRIFTDRVMNGLPPQIFGDGKQTRDFTYVDDVVRGIKAAMMAPPLKGASINIAGGRTIMVNELVEKIRDLCGKSGPAPEHLPAKAGDVDHTWGDIGLARQLLNWEPTVRIDDGLQLFIEWYKENCHDLTVASSDDGSAQEQRTSLMISDPLTVHRLDGNGAGANLV